MAEQDRINTGAVTLVGGVGTVILILIVLGLQVMFYSMTDAEKARKDSPIASPALVAELTRQREKLDGYRWVDEKKGVVAIPIARAMDLVVREKGASGPQTKGGEAPSAK